jgi:hypothetical protein
MPHRVERPTNGSEVARLLQDAGVRYSFGGDLLGGGSATTTIAHRMVAEDEIASVLADAAGRVLGGHGLAVLPGPILHLSSKPGGTSDVAVARSVGDLAEILAALAVAPALMTQAIGLDFDLDAPPDEDRAVLAPPINAIRLGDGISGPLLVGPGVLRHGAGDRAKAVANALGGGLFNTYGAKGLVSWNDPVHGGTLGLQTGDYERSGMGQGQVVFVSGVDVDEIGSALDASMVIEIHPLALGAAIAASAPTAGNQGGAVSPSGFFAELAALLRPEYEASSLTAPRFASQLVGSLPRDGVVVSDAGNAGFWVGRCAPTVTAGSVIVPSLPCEGFAAAGAVVAQLAGRPSIGVLNGAPDPRSLQIIELGRSWGAPPAIQCLRTGSGGGDAVAHKRATDRQWARHRALGGRSMLDEPAPDIDTFEADDLVEAAIVDLLGPRRQPFG